MATPRGSSMAPSTPSIESGSGCSASVGQLRYRRSPPSQPPWPAKTTSGQRFWCPRRQRVAVPAVQRGIDRDPHAVERAALDHAGELVADHERVRELGVADAALLEPVQVRAADPDGLDPHQALLRPRRWHGLLGEAQVAGPVEARDRDVS